MTGEWQPISTAPRDGTLIVLLCGETIPDRPLIEVGSYAKGDECEELGYREFAKYGGWLIWNTADNFYVADVVEPTHWMALPAPPEAA